MFNHKYLDGKLYIKILSVLVVSITLIGLTFYTTSASTNWVNLGEKEAAIASQSNLSQTSATSIECSVSALIEAINSANEMPGADVIDLSAGCTYQITRIDNIDPIYRNNGLPVITSAITIDGHGATITSSYDDMRAFQVAQDAHLTLKNVEISGISTNNEGGGVLNHGTLTISNTTLATNAAIKGGAIYNLGSATIYNSTFYYNSACC